MMILNQQYQIRHNSFSLLPKIMIPSAQKYHFNNSFCLKPQLIIVIIINLQTDNLFLNLCLYNNNNNYYYNKKIPLKRTRLQANLLFLVKQLLPFKKSQTIKLNKDHKHQLNLKKGNHIIF